MPHQCLKCGSVFKDGSTAILSGCPDCKGTRFFYTDKPITDDERDRLKQQANKDIKYLIQEMLTSEKTQGKLDDQYLEKELFLKLETEKPQEETPPEEEPEISTSEGMEKIQEMMAKKPSFAQRVKIKKEEEEKELEMAAKPTQPKKEEETVVIESKKKEDKVDVIRIKEKGVYEIDLERLMNNNPIIVQRDGSYLVHLPSVFEKAKGNREEMT